MAARSPSAASLAVLCLLGTLLLGLAIWAVADADDEPRSEILSEGDLTAEDPDSGKGRVEIVRTGDRVWLKLQVRDLPADPDTLVLGAPNEDEPILVIVTGDGDYDLPPDAADYTGPVELLDGSTVLLAGTVSQVEA